MKLISVRHLHFYKEKYIWLLETRRQMKSLNIIKSILIVKYIIWKSTSDELLFEDRWWFIVFDKQHMWPNSYQM